MSRIPQSFIDELMARVDIAEVVGARVPLKKAGREFKACCPFHTEKTPSFTVSPTKQFYHCFGCGAHGTAINFLMEHDHLGFVEAIEELARDVGLEVPREAGPARDRGREALYETMRRAEAFYTDALRTHRPAIDYLQGRGLDGQTAARFGIGYAPGGWDALLSHCGDGEEVIERLSQCGLIIEREQGGYYDRFRDRIMFPIRDSRGRTIAFGGRVLGSGEPKYLNSPETPLFHKGRELYGLYEARQALRSIPRLLVVEGYMDVVGLARAGIDYAVATLGTATTDEHLRRLFRISDEVVFCFDGDAAGRRAAWRALENALPVLTDGHQISFLFLPEGEDPDSLVGREGAAAFEDRLHDARPLSEFLLDHLAAEVDTGSIDGRARLAEIARPLLRRIPDGVYKDLLTQRLAEVVGLDRTRLGRILAGDRPREAGFKPATRGAGEPPRPRSNLVRQAITLVLHHPAAAAEVTPPADLGSVELRGIELLKNLLEAVRSNPRVSTAGLLERWRDRPEHPHLLSLAANEVLVSDTAAGETLNAVLERLVETEGPGRRTAVLLAKAREQELEPDEKEELRALLGRRGEAAGRPQDAG
jgi:DNA primase